VNGNCPKHLRSAWLTACSALVLAVGGCGGEDSPPDNAPRIDAAAATQLADSSEEIASLIDAGDVCTAAHRADELLAAAEAGVEKGTVPPALASELTSKAEALRNEVNCPAPPPPPFPVETEEDDDDEGEKRKGKKKDEDDDGD
jgi:hypothetical protein